MNELIKKYLNGELSKIERISFLKSIQTDRVLQKQFVEFQNQHALLNLAKQLTNREEGERGYIHFRNKQRDKKIKSVVFKNVIFAAAICLLMLATGLVSNYLTKKKLEVKAEESSLNVVLTPAGQRACVILQDGSEVWLNAKSRLTYPSQFIAAQRRVTVEGEAFFKVIKNPDKPFIVTANNVEMEVLGTEFNVYNYRHAGLVQASLLSGSLKIYFSHKEDNAIILKPNEQLTAQDGEMIVQSIPTNENFLWRDGIYAFNQEPLGQILKKIELYYDVKIIVNNESILGETFTGKFRQRDSLDDIFRILSQIRPFNIEMDRVNNIYKLK